MPGKRWAFPLEILESVEVVNGQRVCEAILVGLLERHVAHLATIVAVKKAREAD